MLKKLTFKQKLWIPLICSLLCITGVFIFDAIQIRDIRIEERKHDLSNIDDIALNAVNYFGDLADSGALSKEQAQKNAIDVIKKLRFGKDGYIAINSFDGVSVVNPAAPANDGKNMIDFKDANGLYLYREIAMIGKSEAGSGFAHYVWQHPGQTALVPKLSRIVTYKPWEWTMLTGVYMDDIDSAFQQSLLRSGAVLLAVCAALAAIVFVTNRSLSRTIGGAPEYASTVASTIADNDLRLIVNTQDEDRNSVLFAIKVMQSNLVNTITEIRSGANSIANASAEIASGSMDLSSRTESQAGALEETAAAMEELNSTVKQNAENAEKVNDLAQSACVFAEEGSVMVGKLIDTMGEIDAKAKRINEIVTVIDGIAFQTNILALNASIESAHAGDYGRGFAVVATEVRNLSRRSADAARQVRELIESSNSTVQSGVELSSQVGVSINNMMDGTKEVSHLIAGIAAASQEQASGIAQISAAVSHMDEVTQKNAALVEESAAAANILNDQAEQLLELVSVFHLNEIDRFEEAHEPGTAARKTLMHNKHAGAIAPGRTPQRNRLIAA